jgi:hypothetical protein
VKVRDLATITQQPVDLCGTVDEPKRETEREREGWKLEEP